MVTPVSDIESSLYEYSSLDGILVYYRVTRGFPDEIGV